MRSLQNFVKLEILETWHRFFFHCTVSCFKNTLCFRIVCSSQIHVHVFVLFKWVKIWLMTELRSIYSSFFFSLTLLWIMICRSKIKIEYQFDSAINTGTYHHLYHVLWFIYDGPLHVHIHYRSEWRFGIRNERLFHLHCNWSDWMEFKWNLIRLNWAKERSNCICSMHTFDCVRALRTSYKRPSSTMDIWFPSIFLRTFFFFLFSSMNNKVK